MTLREEGSFWVRGGQESFEEVCENRCIFLPSFVADGEINIMVLGVQNDFLFLTISNGFQIFFDCIDSELHSF